MTEQTMTPDEVLAVMNSYAIADMRMKSARTAVGALIARNAELEAERCQPATHLYKDTPSRLRAFALILESDGAQLLFKDATYVGAGWRVTDIDYVKRLSLFDVACGHYEVCVNGDARAEVGHA